MRVARNRWKGRQSGKGRRAHHTDGVPRWTRRGLAEVHRRAEEIRARLVIR